MTTQLWWYVDRAAGMVGWALLAANVVWGLAISTKTKPRTVRPTWMLDLHRFLGGLATIFTGVHIVGLVADNYTHFGPTEILVPIASSWHPDAVAWASPAMYLLAAVELTSLARRRLPKGLWRSGTDTSNAAFTTMVWIVCAVIVGLRCGACNTRCRHRPTPAPSACERIPTTTTVRPVPARRLRCHRPRALPCGPTPSTHPGGAIRGV